jgi:hypothetical protein
MMQGRNAIQHLAMASELERAGARRESEDGCRSAATDVEAIKARAPGIDIASPAAAPKITRRILDSV